MINDTQIFDSRLLVIDDEQINIELLCDVLEEAGYSNIVSETNPLIAIETYKENDFDLILLDLNMPELDGFGVMKEIIKLDKAVTPPILVLTALNDQSVCNRALSCGAIDFLSKPFDPDEALNRIKNILVTFHIRSQLIHLNENLEALVKERTDELFKTKLKVIQHLSFAAEYRDTETAAHTIRVGEYSKLLGERLGLDKEKIELLHRAAPLHDIGKIGIPDAILLKPGKFEPEEWTVMQTHATIGVEILQDNNDPLIEMAKKIALTHHEKWDGTGYPSGISGNDIPIEGRIVMLADVYDALTMVRPYKKAWTKEKAIELIINEKGKSFDPTLVDLFLDLLDEFSSIRKKFTD